MNIGGTIKILKTYETKRPEFRPLFCFLTYRSFPCKIEAELDERRLIMKKLLSLFLAAVLALSSVAITTESASAISVSPNRAWFVGSDFTDNRYVSSTFDYIRAKHPQLSLDKTYSQCFGWAEKMRETFGSKFSYKEYVGLKFTKKNFLKKCKGVKAGTHLRLGYGKYYDGYNGHSVCLLKVTDKKVYWTDNNWEGYNKIAYFSGSVSDFMTEYGQYDYINMIHKVTKYKNRTTPKLAIRKASDGRGQLCWTKTTNTQKYKVYRSTSKNGTYKLIKTTTKYKYKDTTAKRGKTYYYKVKSVKAEYKDRTSNKCSFKAKKS